MFDPITFAIAKSFDFIRAALTLISSSGNDVAREIIVNPITALLILLSLARITDPWIINQPPINNIIIETIRKKNDDNSSIYNKIKYN